MAPAPTRALVWLCGALLGAASCARFGYEAGSGAPGGDRLAAADGTARRDHSWPQDRDASAVAVAGTHLWTKRFGGPGADEGCALAAAPSGEIYLAGRSSSGTDFGNGPVQSAGTWDVFIAGLRADGSYGWARSFGGSIDDRGEALAVGSDGTLLATGLFQGPVDFGGGVVTPPTTAPASFLVAYAPGGAYRWGKAFFASHALSLVLDPAGNIGLTGSLVGPTTFGGATLTPAVLDAFVASLDAKGVHRWSRSAGGASIQDSGTGIASDAEGNLYVSGHFAETADFGGGPLTSATAAQTDIILASYAASGSHRWSRRFGGAGGDVGSAVAVDGAGNVYLAGRFGASFDIDGKTVTSAGGADILLASFTSSGTGRWAQRFGASGPDASAELAIDTSGTLYLVGSFSGTVSFGGPPLTSEGATDAFVSSFTSAGAARWSARSGGPLDDAASAVALAPGSVLVTGRFRGTASFGPTVLTSVGEEDVFLTRYAR